DRFVIADWFRNPKNHAMVYGASGKTVVNGESKSKMAGLTMLANHVNRQNNNRLVLDGNAMRARLRTYHQAYVTAKQFLSSTRAGLDEDDMKKGYKTLMDRVNDKCPYFDLMNEVFGTKPNTIAHAEVE
ncbi:hypothetical protein DFS34DRAFT_563868, partial [Phlyctochytrium arcticum]